MNNSSTCIYSFQIVKARITNNTTTQNIKTRCSQSRAREVSHKTRAILLSISSILQRYVQLSANLASSLKSLLGHTQTESVFCLLQLPFLRFVNVTVVMMIFRSFRVLFWASHLTSNDNYHTMAPEP